MNIYGAYVLSGVGGWLVAGISVYVMRRSIEAPREFFRWIDIWVGFTERLVVTTLVIWAPGLVAGFIGGWVALKVAANWQRREGPQVGLSTLVALVGSVISFAVAIGCGLSVRPESLAAWAG